MGSMHKDATLAQNISKACRHPNISNSAHFQTVDTQSAWSNQPISPLPLPTSEEDGVQWGFHSPNGLGQEAMRAAWLPIMTESCVWGWGGFAGRLYDSWQPLYPCLKEPDTPFISASIKHPHRLFMASHPALKWNQWKHTCSSLALFIFVLCIYF